LTGYIHFIEGLLNSSGKHVGLETMDPTLPYDSQHTTTNKELETILDRKIVKRKGMSLTKVLVKWKHQLPEDVT